MCLTIQKGHKGVVLKAPHIAYKGVRRNNAWCATTEYSSPYKKVPLKLGKVITAKVDIRPSYNRTSQEISEGLHFSTSMPRAKYHGYANSMLYVLLLPGSRVYYNKYAGKQSYGENRDCATNKYVLFESLKELHAWWDANWEKYTK